MRIAIDARALRWAGIGRYTRSLLAALVTSPTDFEFTILVASADLDYWQRLQSSWPTASQSKLQTVVVEGSYYSWREQLLFWRQLEAVTADLFHFTHFNLPLLFRRPYVVTIHDITRFMFPGEQRQDLWQQVAYEQVFAQAVRHARQIISVSHTTTQALRGLPLSLSAPVTTIYEGVEDSFKQPIAPSVREKIKLLIGTTDPYFLHVGVWMSHKNLPRLLLAFKAIVTKYPQLKLVLTGKPKPGYSNVLRQVQDLGLEQQVIFTGFVPSTLLPALYSEAVGLVFPSLYEGFGLPPLEALAVGTPVIAANVSSLPEILGPTAIYCNPEYVPSIQQAMEQLVRQPELGQHLRTMGKIRAQSFTWDKTASAHLAVYKQAMVH